MTCGANRVNYWMRVGTRDNDVRTKREDERRLSDSKAAIARDRLAEPVSLSLTHTHTFSIHFYMYINHPFAHVQYTPCAYNAGDCLYGTHKCAACACSSLLAHAASSAKRITSSTARSNRISNGRRATCIVSPERQRLTSPDDISFAL